MDILVMIYDIAQNIAFIFFLILMGVLLAMIEPPSSEESYKQHKYWQ